MSKRIWITWEVQRRNRSMAGALNATLHELVLNATAWQRYPVLILKTISLVWRTRPELVFSQNPSIVLSVLMITLGKILSIPVVIDAHNAGLFPAEGKYHLLNKVASFINNRALFVIVSNLKLKAYVEENGGSAFVIPDPIPEMGCLQSYKFSHDAFNIVYVCSWADDEPYREVIEAARHLDKTVCIYMTGNSKGRHSHQGSELPENVVLTGFLSNDEYDALLCSCDSVMVLTTREDCLVCGAYEGISVEKPLILSNTASLKQYFEKGCIYTENTVAGICKAINKMLQTKDKLAVDIRDYKVSTVKKTTQIIHDFNKTLPDSHDV